MYVNLGCLVNKSVSYLEGLQPCTCEFGISNNLYIA